jgi:hypothetical protein
VTKGPGDSDTTIIVRVPITIRRRGGRKVVQTPVGYVPWTPREAQLDNILLKAIVKAFRWKRMLDDGDVATITELAARETSMSPMYPTCWR